MDSSAKNRVTENFSSGPAASKSERKTEEQGSADREVKEAIGKAAYVEAVDLDESAETTGRVSEVLKNSREDGGAGAMATAVKAQIVDLAEIRQNLLNTLPSESQMRQQIESEIKTEIDYLHKKALKMIRSPGKMSYFEMTNLMKKIRELKGILLELIKASLDTLKTLWLRYVHGIM